MTPTITTLKWVPAPARGLLRDMRARWAFEEVGQAYMVEYIDDGHTVEHRTVQPFGLVPVYRDDEVSIFESGAIVLRIAERAGRLIPTDPLGRYRALQWVMASLNTIEPMVMALVTNNYFEADRNWSAERRPKVIADLEARLADLEAAFGEGPWLEGDVFTVGDLMMVSILCGAAPFGALSQFPRLSAYMARGVARSARVKALADHLASFDS